MLAKRYGSLGFLGWGMLLNSVFAFLVPVAARQGGVFWLCIVRFIQGLGEGPIVPCTHAMLAKWIPPNERSRMGAAVYAGKIAMQKTAGCRNIGQRMNLTKFSCFNSIIRCTIRNDRIDAAVWFVGRIWFPRWLAINLLCVWFGRCDLVHSFPLLRLRRSVIASTYRRKRKEIHHQLAVWHRQHYGNLKPMRRGASCNSQRL